MLFNDNLHKTDNIFFAMYVRQMKQPFSLMEVVHYLLQLINKDEH